MKNILNYFDAADSEPDSQFSQGEGTAWLTVFSKNT